MSSSVEVEHPGMSTGRWWLVNGFIFGYLALVAVLFPTGYEIWPFCTYGMYANKALRHDSTEIEMYTVAAGQEKWVDLRNLHVIPWGYVLPRAGFKAGWTSENTRQFFAVALRQMQRDDQSDDPSAPVPTAIRAYAVTWHYPDSGDYQPVVLQRHLLLEVKGGQP